MDCRYNASITYIIAVLCFLTWIQCCDSWTSGKGENVRWKAYEPFDCTSTFHSLTFNSQCTAGPAGQPKPNSSFDKKLLKYIPVALALVTQLDPIEAKDKCISFKRQSRLNTGGDLGPAGPKVPTESPSRKAESVEGRRQWQVSPSSAN